MNIYKTKKDGPNMINNGNQLILLKQENIIEQKKSLLLSIYISVNALTKGKDGVLEVSNTAG